METLSCIMMWLRLLTITHNSKCAISDLDRYTDPRENASIGADTDTEYRMDASVFSTGEITLI